MFWFQYTAYILKGNHQRHVYLRAFRPSLRGFMPRTMALRSHLLSGCRDSPRSQPCLVALRETRFKQVVRFEQLPIYALCGFRFVTPSVVTYQIPNRCPVHEHRAGLIPVLLPASQSRGKHQGLEPSIALPLLHPSKKPEFRHFGQSFSRFSWRASGSKGPEAISGSPFCPVK